MRGKRHRYTAGKVLMRQGDPSETMHVLLTGRVRVEREQSPEGKVLLAELGANEVVGEIGVLDHAPRSATVTAIEATETLDSRRGRPGRAAGAGIALELITSPRRRR
ncbi:MAG: hypothetical protein AUH44_01290 [Chloroflexi bacterium 13_1_40CM_68_15]|nr:MAG: hypothetical protein AUH44_01290 [Chloroflexi bacterium 13_1_40CM_68_15]